MAQSLASVSYYDLGGHTLHSVMFSSLCYSLSPLFISCSIYIRNIPHRSSAQPVRPRKLYVEVLRIGTVPKRLEKKHQNSVMPSISTCNIFKCDALSVRNYLRIVQYYGELGIDIADREEIKSRSSVRFYKTTFFFLCCRFFVKSLTN